MLKMGKMERKLITKAYHDKKYREQVCLALDINIKQLEYRFRILGLAGNASTRSRKLGQDDERLIYELRSGTDLTWAEIGRKFEVCGNAAALAAKRYENRALKSGELLGNRNG